MYFKNNQVVEYRVGRAGRNAPDWEPWTHGPLHVQFCKDRMVFFTPDNDITAEYSPDDCTTLENGNIIGCVEDYYIEIKQPGK